jgi:hypothetical protein
MRRLPVSDVVSAWGLDVLFPRLGAARHAGTTGPSPGVQPAADEPAVVNSRALRRFLTHVGTVPAPVLLDLGPVVGSNVTFFGEQLNCKVHIEDLHSDIDRHLRGGRTADLPAFLSKRFSQEAGTVDGVLLWDVCDYLDRPSAQALATTLVRLLRDGGALLGFFGTDRYVSGGVTKFIVSDQSHVRQQAHPSAAVRQRPLTNREITRMFDGLSVSESFLLKSGLREMLFRKDRGRRDG